MSSTTRLRKRQDALGRHVTSIEIRKPTPAERELFYFYAQSIRDDLQHDGITMTGMELSWTDKTRTLAKVLMGELHTLAGVRACRECGCTDERGCEVPNSGCEWVSGNLCSSCVQKPSRKRK